MLKTDLHSHTNYIMPKRDSVLSPKELIDFVASKNFDVLAITEHASLRFVNGVKYLADPVKTYFHFKNYAKKKGILLIPGVETIVEGKEVLLVNFTGDARKVKTFADVGKLRDENVLIIAPHPFFGRLSCLKDKLIENINVFDAIEHCHFYTKLINPNKKAIKVMKDYNKPLIANSDAHSKSQINTNFSLVDAEKNIDSILEAVRKNKIKIVTKPLPWNIFLNIAFRSITSMCKKRLL